MNCCNENCYMVSLPECEDISLGTQQNIKIKADTTFAFVLEDKFGKKFSGTVISDSEGVLIIEEARFPTHMLNHSAGDFILTLIDDEDIEVTFEIGNNTFSCLSLTFTETHYTES